jgi:mannose-6-phosphate isomerase
LLLKVLAIDKPLSIQVHPDKKQAEKGWAQEEHLRSRLHKDQWNYKDPNRKAEIGYALEPVTALSGFRPLKETRTWLKRLIPSALHAFFPFLYDEDDEDALIRRFFEALYTLGKNDLATIVDELFVSLENADDLPLESAEGFLMEKGIVEYCRTDYPLDPGLLAPFFLNVVHLKIGEGLFIPPGVLHAYMKGVVLEVMSASDNVLRGGLTPKRVDLHELFSIIEVIGKPVELARQLIGRSGRIHLLTPTEEFHLMVLHSGTYDIDERFSIELLFQTEGATMFKGAGEERMLKKGSCHVVAAGLDSYRLDVAGTLFIADVPR